MSDVTVEAYTMPTSTLLTAGLDQGRQLRQTSRALRELRCAVDQSQEVVFMVDSAGLLGYVNPAFVRLTGYSAQEALGKNLSSIAGEQPKPEAYKRIREQVLQRGICRGALEVCGKDGSTFELDLAITGVRDHKARTASLVCTGRDMTNQRELEVELSHARGMDTMGTMAGGVAHDFNNLLMVISAHAELALHSARPEDPLRRSCKRSWGPRAGRQN